MPEAFALKLADLPSNTKKAVTIDEVKILLVRTGDDAADQPTLFAVEAECPHAKGPLEQGAVCNGRLVCPWHTGTFELATGALVEPPPLRDLQRYPVRVDGEDIFVDPTPMAATRPALAGQSKHLVFAGGGAATAAALAYLRDAGFAGKITVIDPDLDEPIDRTQLSKDALGGKVSLEAIPLFVPSGHPEAPGQQGSLDPLRIKRLKTHVTALDVEGGAVTVGDSVRVPFDALLLATGGRPKLPDLPGVDLPHVFTLRHVADLRRIEPLLQPDKGAQPEKGTQPGKRAVLLGDSFIAFEAASALRQRGLHVTIVARSELPFAKQFGMVAATALNSFHKSHGTQILSSTEAVAITERAVNVKDVRGEDLGDRIMADVVIFAVGVEPVVQYAAGLPHAAEGGGLALDRNLRVARQVWAAGDIASVNGTRIEHWRLAEQHGRTAAEAMYAFASGDAHGPAEPFAGVPFFWTYHYGKRLGYAGHAADWDRIDYDGDPAQLDFLAYFLKNDRVVAVLGCGRDAAIASLMEPMRQPLTLEGARQITSVAAA